MSLVHDSLQRSSGAVRTWYLKAADGAVYGPKQLSVLCEWAAQSRIVPGNEISEDAQTWMPVENLPELKLEWVAELPDGATYGPFNVLAVPFLFNSGTLPADAKLTNRATGKTLQVPRFSRPPPRPMSRPGSSLQTSRPRSSLRKRRIRNGKSDTTRRSGRASCTKRSFNRSWSG